MNPPQEIDDFLMQEYILWEWNHPHIILLPEDRQSRSMITDSKLYLHPTIKTYLKQHNLIP